MQQEFLIKIGQEISFSKHILFSKIKIKSFSETKKLYAGLSASQAAVAINFVANLWICNGLREKS